MKVKIWKTTQVKNQQNVIINITEFCDSTAIQLHSVHLKPVRKAQTETMSSCETKTT